MPSRRNVILGALGAAGLAAWLKPKDKGGVYTPYFTELNQTLKDAGIGTPSLIIDLDRLDRNIDRITQTLGTAPWLSYRVVTKSVPSPELVRYISERAQTQAQMIFHLPFLLATTQVTPDADILIGKPFPIAAVEEFYRKHAGTFEPAQQLQWLVDTTARLQQYLNFARANQLKLRVNLELDVGLHRGGFVADEALSDALGIIRANPQHLTFSGFMGYDAHLMGIPSALAKRELPKVKARYQAALDILNSQFQDLVTQDLCFNGAGSPTFRNYQDKPLLTEVSAGTCLMKPTHYDIASLEDFEPAAYIASPVLKRGQGGRLPALEWTAPLIRAWDPNQAQMYFGYSGNWMADMESPPGLASHFAYKSSNQEGYQASSNVELDVDDFIFLRPHQSEAVLLQFGDLIAVRGNQIEARWPVLPNDSAAHVS